MASGFLCNVSAIPNQCGPGQALEAMEAAKRTSSVEAAVSGSKLLCRHFALFLAVLQVDWLGEKESACGWA